MKSPGIESVLMFSIPEMNETGCLIQREVLDEMMRFDWQEKLNEWSDGS